MTFAVLPRRETQPGDARRPRDGSAVVHRRHDDRDSRAALDAFGLRTVDAARGHVELEPTDYVENSLGAVQGGVVATMVERAAELALSHAAGRPLAPVGLQLSYLALARGGPDPLLGRGARGRRPVGERARRAVRRRCRPAHDGWSRRPRAPATPAAAIG